MLILLDESSYCVGEFKEKLDRSQSSISRHLRWMQSVDLVQGETEGQQVRYSAKRPEIMKKILELRNCVTSRIDSG